MRFSSIHEQTRYEVIVRGIESRAEAEAIVLAVERLPASSAWQPMTLEEAEDLLRNPGLMPVGSIEIPTVPDNHPAVADSEDSTDGINAQTRAVVP